MYYLAIESIIDLLRTTVRKDSSIWKILIGIRRAFASFRRYPINKRRWSSNYKKFERIIEEYSKESHPFLFYKLALVMALCPTPYISGSRNIDGEESLLSHRKGNSND